MDRFGLEIVGEWKNGIFPKIELDYVSGSFSATSPDLIWGWGAIRGEVHCRDTDCEKKEWDSPVLQDLPVTSLDATGVTADWFFSQTQSELIQKLYTDFEYEHSWTLADLIARGPTFWCRKR